MAEPVIVTVHDTPSGAPDTDSLHLELHAEPGARLTLHLGAHQILASPAIPAQPAPADPTPDSFCPGDGGRVARR